MKLILLGPPGAGKGTQAEILSHDLNIPTISTGNILRAAIAAGSPTGLKAKSFMAAGKLVPDEVIMGIIRERLAADDCRKGFILDGVPRPVAQAQAMEAAGIEVDHVVSLEVPEGTIVKRMTGRRVCGRCGAPYHITANPPKSEGVCDVCGGGLIVREDDKEHTVLRRLEVYHAETEPLKDFYREKGILQEVPGDLGTVEETTQAVKRALGA